jgi:methylamine--corrinoid protein Co-methyltransferase
VKAKLISLLELAERAYTGTKLPENEWNLSLYRTIHSLLTRYSLQYSGPDRFFDVDDDEVDQFFDAAVTLLSELGVYCVTTNRIIPLTQDEIRNAAKSASNEIIVGAGTDQRILRKRVVEDHHHVNFHIGGHCPWPQDVALTMMSAYANVQRNDYIEGFNVTEIDGYELRGEALSAYAGRRTIEIMRTAVSQAGRPGMAIAYYPTLTRAGVTLAPLDPDNALRKTDGVLLSTQRDLKIEENYLQTAMMYERYGGFRLNGGTSSVIGGFCGPLEGAMLETIAKHLVGWICYRDQFSYGPAVYSQAELVHGRNVNLRVNLEHLPPNWATYVIARAIQRHSDLIVFGAGIRGVSGTGGPMSVSHLLASARNVIATTVLGSNVSGGSTPYHGEWLIQVSDAAVNAHITRQEIRILLSQLDHEIMTHRTDDALASDTYVGDQRMSAYHDFASYLTALNRVFNYQKLIPHPTLVTNIKKASQVLENYGFDIETII